VWLAEHAELDLTHDGVRGSGVQLGAEPEPYRAGYVLVADDGWTTRSLVVEAMCAAGSRRLELSHDGEGNWTIGGGSGDAAELAGALDCDLAFSPLTNLMPVRRHRLHEEPGSVDISVAWVSLPDLHVHRAEQRYEHVRRGVVRFRSEDFTADLELDEDGLVVLYPQLARRVAAA
jgi:hypothetical protein